MISLYKYSLLGLYMILSSITFSMDTVSAGDPDVNTFTGLVRAATKEVLKIRDQSAKIANPEQDPQARNKVEDQIKNLLPKVQEIKTFVAKAIKKDPDFKHKLNNEGMPPRIIEEELECTIRYDLDAVIRSMGLGTMDTHYDVGTLAYEEDNIYSMIENLKGPNLRFNDLKPRYKEYKRFFFEKNEGKSDRRYTQQEAHVVLHIAGYVAAVEQAYDLAKYDHGRHLCNLLKVYVEWLHQATHTHADVNIVMAHGSLLSINDKNGKTMLDWTNDLSKQLSKSKVSGEYLKKAQEQFTEIKRSLRKGLFENSETGMVEPVKTRDVLSIGEKLTERSLKPDTAPVPENLKGLNLETKKDVGIMREDVESILEQTGKQGTTQYLLPE